MFRVKNENQILFDALNQLSLESSISNLSPGSKARALIEAMSSAIGGLGENISNGIFKSLLPNASGPMLDLIGDMVGVQRLPELSAKINLADQNLRYYVANGTFGDINNGASIVVPAGTLIQAGGANGRNEAVFMQRQDAVLGAGLSEFYFEADQIGNILAKGIAPGALASHNFVGYAQIAFQSLLVENTKGVSGRPVETDNNLRYRISNALLNRAKANETSIRISALVVPGVSDIKILPNRAGVGTYDVVVYGTANTVPNSVIEEVQRQINANQAVGTRGIATPPRLVGISLSFDLSYIEGSTQNEKSAANRICAQAIRSYVDNISSDSTLVINSLIPVILNSHPVIRSVGAPNRPFNEVLIWRSSEFDQNRFSRNLISDYVVRSDEDILIEPFITNPILIREK